MGFREVFGYLGMSSGEGAYYTKNVAGRGTFAASWVEILSVYILNAINPKPLRILHLHLQLQLHQCGQSSSHTNTPPAFLLRTREFHTSNHWIPIPFDSILYSQLELLRASNILLSSPSSLRRLSCVVELPMMSVLAWNPLSSTPLTRKLSVTSLPPTRAPRHVTCAASRRPPPSCTPSLTSSSQVPLWSLLPFQNYFALWVWIISALVLRCNLCIRMAEF